MSDLNITATPLHIPLNTTFKQASSIRNTGESIWVDVHWNGLSGIGEGCPRSYVTGEDVKSGIPFLNSMLSNIIENCTSIENLKQWVTAQREWIDQHPSVWCAVELALLDLFARKEQKSVEALLGLDTPIRSYQYSAIISDGNPSKVEALIGRFIKLGFKDFKIKINGNLEFDQMKLRTLNEQCQAANIEDFRIRLDANNLWSGKTTDAINYLNALGNDYFAVEEPVEPLNAKALSQISVSANTAIILDESLLKLSDLDNYESLPGKFIANIKVCRVGGPLRSLAIISALKEKNWPIIIGAHVGETSVLTRAAMLVAQAAGEQLIAQEGAFGEILLAKDILTPPLQFGHGGVLNLKDYGTENWQLGWGLQKRSTL